MQGGAHVCRVVKLVRVKAPLGSVKRTVTLVVKLAVRDSRHGQTDGPRIGGVKEPVKGLEQVKDPRTGQKIPGAGRTSGPHEVKEPVKAHPKKDSTGGTDLGPSRGFGVELHAEEGLGDVNEPLVGHVVDVDKVGLPVGRQVRVVHRVAAAK